MKQGMMRRCWIQPHIISALVFVLGLLSACNLNSTPTIPQSTPQPNNAASLTVAWVDSGNLYVWQRGDTLARRVAVGGVIRPYIAPDGQTIAFTRGSNSIAETLWTINSNGSGESELVGNNSREATYRTGTNQIGDVDWLDAEVLYFNTLQLAQPSYIPRNDLYRANTRTREVSLIRGAGDGGRFMFSPDKQSIALVSAGTYGTQDGAIRVTDLLGQAPIQNLLFFVGVASGSHVPFYPTVHWLPDNSALLAVIPDKDLIYNEQSNPIPPTRLWRLPVDAPSERSMIGSINASFFGLPSLNQSADTLFYLERIPQTNQFSLMVKMLSDEIPTVYTTGGVDTLSYPQWINNTQFIYTQNEAGQVFVGQVGQLPIELSTDTVYNPLFIGENEYVAITPTDNGFSIRLVVNGVSESLGDSPTLPVFDAVDSRP